MTLLTEIGFKFNENDPRHGLMKFPNVTFKQVKFLKSYMTEEMEGLY